MSKLRQHFIHSLVMDKFTPFPKNQQVPTAIPSKTYDILCNCRCRFPDVCGDLVECTLCKKWYHMVCVDYMNNAGGQGQSWHCDTCIK